MARRILLVELRRPVDAYVRDVSVPILGGSFNTVIGFIFLAIVLVSPDGLMGIWDRVTTGRRRPAFGATVEPAAATSGGTARGTSGQVAGHGTTEPPEEGGGK